MSLAAAVLGAPDRASALQLIEAAEPATRREAVDPVSDEVVRLLRVDAHRALEIADRATLLAAGAADPAARARADWVRGHAMAVLLRNDEAIQHYRDARKAYESLGRLADVARIGIGEVNALTYLGRYEDALRVGETTRKALLQTSQRIAAARLDMNLGNLHHRRNLPANALECYDRALRVARREGQADVVRLVQLNRATALSALGRLPQAERLYRRVRAQADRAGESRIRAFADFNLGWTLFQRGEYGRAYDTLDDARSAFEQLGDEHYLALSLIDLAELLLEVARFQRAASVAERARNLVARLGLRFEEGRAALLTALAALGLGDLRAAESRLAEARELFRLDGNASAWAVCDVWIAELRRRQGDFESAAKLLRDAIPTFSRDRLHVQLVAARVALASVCCAIGDPRVARTELDFASRLLRSVASPWLSARVAHLRGKIAELDGSKKLATRHYQDAIRRIERIRGRIGVDEFRVSFADDRAPVYADLIELTLARGGRRAVTDAFALVERARSRALVDLLAGRLGSGAARGDAASLQLFDRLRDLRGEVNRLSGRGSDREGGLRRAEADVAAVRRCEEEMTETLRRLDRRNSALGALSGGAELLELGQMQEALPDGVEVVEYYLGARGSWAIVANRHDARAVKLGASATEIASKLERFRFQIEKCCHGEAYQRTHGRLLREGSERHLAELAEVLWAPLEVEAKRVVVVPHGPLHSLPFAALPAGDGLVLDRHVVSYLPSASCARYFSEDAGSLRGRSRPQVLAVEAGGESIPETRREVDRVRRAFPRGRTLRGPAANRARFRSAATSADVIHIATHGIFRRDDPSFSSVQLADGWLSLYDVYGLRLDARLVCLSACQSGRTWTGPADEIVGLIRGFLHAGCGSMAVSLWPVEDRSTAVLMEHFYNGVRDGVRFDEALHAAMAQVRHEWPHPFHWAPFVLIGGTSLRPLAARGRTPAASKTRSRREGTSSPSGRDPVS